MIKDLFSIPEDKKIRVIVDTDAACEADDPYAIVHALLSPKLIVKGIVAEHFAEDMNMFRHRMLKMIHRLRNARQIRLSEYIKMLIRDIFWKTLLQNLNYLQVQSKENKNYMQLQNIIKKIVIFGQADGGN